MQVCATWRRGLKWRSSPHSRMSTLLRSRASCQRPAPTLHPRVASRRLRRARLRAWRVSLSGHLVTSRGLPSLPRRVWPSWGRVCTAAVPVAVRGRCSSPGHAVSQCTGRKVASRPVRARPCHVITDSGMAMVQPHTVTPCVRACVRAEWKRGIGVAPASSDAPQHRPADTRCAPLHTVH